MLLRRAPGLALVIDLTQTDRYYDKRVSTTLCTDFPCKLPTARAASGFLSIDFYRCDIGCVYLTNQSDPVGAIKFLSTVRFVTGKDRIFVITPMFVSTAPVRACVSGYLSYILFRFTICFMLHHVGV